MPPGNFKGGVLICDVERDGEMKKIITTTACAALLCLGGPAMATSIYYEATDVVGTAEITYGLGPDVNAPPVFSFAATSGSVDENLGLFVPGEYTISFTLDGFWADFNGDTVSDFDLPDTSFTSDPYLIPALPPFNGTAGALTWSVDPYSGGTVSYDFGDVGPITNFDVNEMLAEVDLLYSGGMNGVMTADIYWDTLRIELNRTVSVPEPSTILIMGLGLLGLVGYNRRRIHPGKVA
ncbi:MAG TPA: PEP-CTERM sorting domain-containing protein [Gammaproteobacteria bacterium]|nr:PEP-CTERM sorting domain-containing protein [Gammaproteobacteria bacterium]